MTAGQTAAVFLAMLGVFALTHVLTRVLSRRFGTVRPSARLQVVERLSLGKDRQILLVRAGDTVHLVGLTAQQIQFGPSVEQDLKTDEASQERVS